MDPCCPAEETRVRSRRRAERRVERRVRGSDEETGVEVVEAGVDGQEVVEVLAGTHSRSGKGTEEASNTGIDEGGSSDVNKGHCNIGAVPADVECTWETGVGSLAVVEAVSGDAAGDRGTLST